MKHIILGDIHGRTIWKDILAKEFTGHEIIVFIGDYFDTHENTTGEQQLNNFLDIIAFKDNNPENVILLIGNHDYHYLDVNERYSGYQQGWSYQFREILYKELKKLQMCYLISNTTIICSHAGISNTWLKNQSYKNPEDIMEYINDLFIYKPLSFRFTGSNPYGDDVRSSPIWIREDCLSLDKLVGYTQIVGHTTKQTLRQKGIWVNNKEGFKVQDENIWMIDTLGTSKEYLIIENSIISIGKL